MTAPVETSPPPLPGHQRRKRWLIGLGIVLLLGVVVWRSRWFLSKRALEFADPAIRAWAAKQVREMSNGAYVLTASPIKVDQERHRIAIDTIILLTTPTAPLKPGEKPLPAISARFHNCAIEGIDLAALAAGKGLHATRAGCDTVAVSAEVTATTEKEEAAPDTTAAFLSLTRELKLPKQLPSITLDTVAFPKVQLAIGVLNATGRRTAASLDHLAVRLDSFYLDSEEATRRRGPLLSRGVRVSLDRFEGSKESASRMTLVSLSADLARGTLQVNGFDFVPIRPSLSDSLGFTALHLPSATLEGLDWRALVLTGALRVRAVRADSVRLTLRSRIDRLKDRSRVTATLEQSLRSMHRRVQVDTMSLKAFTVVTTQARSKDSTFTTFGSLNVGRFAFVDDDDAWATPFPLGKVTFAADSIVVLNGDDRTVVAKLAADLGTGRVTATGLRLGATGSDADFFSRLTFRKDRIVVEAGRVVMSGVDFPALLRRDEYLVPRTDVTGFSFDVLIDRGKPADSLHPAIHRTPQAALRDYGLAFRLDTITVAGRVTIRERAADAPQPGVFTFDALQATLRDFSTAPRPGGKTTVQVRADARLMGTGTFHFEVEMPLRSREFSMTWRGRAGAMPAKSLNSFIADATGIQFTGGEVEGVSFDVKTYNGLSTGTVAPRWHGFSVELPGVARADQGLLGGIRRGVAKLAANSLVVRDDNSAIGGKIPLDGALNHQWLATETLPRYLWVTLRDALLPLVKR